MRISNLNSKQKMVCQVTPRQPTQLFDNRKIICQPLSEKISRKFMKIKDKKLMIKKQIIIFGKV